jgi:beta-barrel assembly-enhancing protease
MLCAVVMAACGAHSTKPPATSIAGQSSNAPSLQQQLDDALQLPAGTDYTQQIEKLRPVVDSTRFGTLPQDQQYQALAAAATLELRHGQPTRGYLYLARLNAMPQATFDEHAAQLVEAGKLDYKADVARTLATIAQRWPDKLSSFDSDYIEQVINESKRVPQADVYSLLQSLYDAGWRFKGGIEPSSAWRDLSLLLIQKGRLPQAIEVGAHVTDPYVLIAMRADRRFDPVVAANPAQFDIDAADNRELHELHKAAESMPQSLDVQLRELDGLRRRRHYSAILAITDSIITQVKSTNYPARLYDDYQENYVWILDFRSDALAGLGNWDEAVGQLDAAAHTTEPNISQYINLGDLYCDLGRPADALSAVGKITAKPSPLGVSRLELVTLRAAVQSGDAHLTASSLDYLKVHRADSLSNYQIALLVVNQPEQGARLLMSRLRAPESRQDALQSVQTYAPDSSLPIPQEVSARWRTLIARPDVQAAITAVGRIEAYPLQSPDGL